jgi:hypothetical protein
MGCNIYGQLAGLFNTSAELYRNDGATNEVGEQTNVWTFIEDFICYVDQVIEADRRSNPGLLDNPFYRLTCSRDVDLRVEDRVTIESVNYRVTATKDPGMRGEIWRAILQLEVA